MQSTLLLQHNFYFFPLSTPPPKQTSSPLSHLYKLPFYNIMQYRCTILFQYIFKKNLNIISCTIRGLGLLSYTMTSLEKIITFPILFQRIDFRFFFLFQLIFSNGSMNIAHYTTISKRLLNNYRKNFVSAIDEYNLHVAYIESIRWVHTTNEHRSECGNRNTDGKTIAGITADFRPPV